MTKASNLVNAFLKKPDAPTRKNYVRSNAQLMEAIDIFLAHKKKGHPSVEGVSLNWFYRHKIMPVFGGPKCFSSIRTYVRSSLRLDINTGKAL